MRTYTKETQDELTPQLALDLLRDGNERFVNNIKAHRNSSPWSVSPPTIYINLRFYHITPAAHSIIPKRICFLTFAAT